MLKSNILPVQLHEMSLFFLGQLKSTIRADSKAVKEFVSHLTGVVLQAKETSVPLKMRILWYLEQLSSTEIFRNDQPALVAVFQMVVEMLISHTNTPEGFLSRYQAVRSIFKFVK
jgi:hypothetical protein